MGKKWAFYFISLISALLKEVGCSAENLVADDELVSFDIKKLEFN